ncbi:Predicted ATP-dependent endonuclease of the OLD family, contains P-loop ATPase and TOPRIM domains [Marivirga sericea]|uniref:Predicted ATP-dependent endonuclease of the OLD family, contains P-loop ATPase and TOPRIM domains n=1 Tax=Marivirga sericea TaxID=1028 RepID=A0A1X7L2U7_9BACT|nr:AAA family ATPase [Marivirga sericea]SMG48191.1 Predicted ATP-dependent endonuclease of the OLD family, contains P-loop ATPase and TOPRIM domains [Marivirga sericea]
MIKKIILNNYRCYNSHEIDFKNLSIVVGKNNAGKSTLIESLRLISLVTTRYSNLPFKSPPSWTELPRDHKGVSPSLKGIEFSKENLFHLYSNPPAKIEAIFKNEFKITLYIGSDGEFHAVLFDKQGKVIQSKGEARNVKFPQINILPQIAPLQTNEETLRGDYVLSNLSSSLASRHFRNQLNQLNSKYTEFKRMAEETWPGLRIRELQGKGPLTGNKLSLMVQDETFVAEVGWMGHGLQMWLQTVWFLARSHKSSTIILDEPDVYMHADLQRKLIRYLRNRFAQVIVATHSIEIMAEVEPDEILVIDRNKDKSSFASNLPAVQSIIHNIGSIQNIELARLWNAKKFLIVEGKDVSILKRFQNTLFPFSNEPLDSIPNMPCGGWGGWNYVVGSQMLLKNAGDSKITVYSIFDSDYHSEEEKIKRINEAKAHKIELKIWRKKEIENYLISDSAIYRLIRKSKSVSKTITKDDVTRKIEELVDSLKDDVIDAVATEINHKKRNYTAGKAHSEARNQINPKWDLEKRELVSGKKILKRLNIWSLTEWKTSFSALAIAKEIKLDEIPEEIKTVITKIEQNKRL